MKSLKTTARLTGLGYLVIFITGFFANFYTLESMMVDNDAQMTASNIISQLAQYRMGMVSFSIMVLMDIILAVPLYQLLKRTSEPLASASSILRLINGVIFALALFNLFEIAGIAKNSPDALEVQVMTLLSEFNTMWNVGLLFFGAHLLLLGLLVFKSTSFPKVIGALLLLAGFAYLADSGAQLFMANYQAYKGIFEMLVIGGGVIGEFSLTLWLLIKGVKSERKGKLIQSDSPQPKTLSI